MLKNRQQSETDTVINDKEQGSVGMHFRWQDIWWPCYWTAHVWWS